jgi:CBS domain-containing protein
MRVANLLERKNLPEVVTVVPTADVAAAARLLMQHTIGGLPVVGQDGQLVGFIAEREFVRAVHMHPDGIRNLRVQEIMRRPAPTCAPDDLLTDVTVRMTRERLRHLVVVDGRKIAGIISVGDLVKRRIEELEVEAGVLRDYVVAQRARG